MKTVIFCWIVAAVVLTGIPTKAEEPLMLYDSFETKFLDPSKWVGSDYSIPDGLLLESSRRIKTDEDYGRVLSIMNRGYGTTGSDIGTSVTSTRLIVRDGLGVKTIVATVQVKKVNTVACDDSWEVTNARARIGGYFFNTTDTPTPGSSANDVLAYIAIERSSDSSDPADVLTINGRARKCLDADCFSTARINPVSTVDLGKVHLNEKVRLRLTWDKINHRFIFQRGSGPEYTYGYIVADTSDPGTPYGGLKKLDVTSTVPHCSTEPRPVGYMEVSVENVFVNESAIP